MVSLLHPRDSAPNPNPNPSCEVDNVAWKEANDDLDAAIKTAQNLSRRALLS